jgi:hypothetical protein
MFAVVLRAGHISQQLFGWVLQQQDLAVDCCTQPLFWKSTCLRSLLAVGSWGWCESSAQMKISPSIFIMYSGQLQATNAAAVTLVGPGYEGCMSQHSRIVKVVSLLAA